MENRKRWETYEVPSSVEEKELQKIRVNNFNIKYVSSLLEVPLRPAPFMLLTETARRPGDAPRMPKGGAPGGGRDIGGTRLDFEGEGPGKVGLTPEPPVDMERTRDGTGSSSGACCGILREGGGIVLAG